MEPMQTILFWILAVLTGFSAVATVVTQNIVRSATFLLFALAGTSGIFFLLGADLVGAIQLLVYVGGTLILVVFGVMLTAQGPFINMKSGSAEWAISGVVGLMLLSVLSFTILSGVKLETPRGSAAAKFAPKAPLSSDAATANYSATIGQGFLGVGVGPAHEEQGRPVRMHYLFPFEIVSVHLLVVLIGAAYLARAKRRREVAA